MTTENDVLFGLPKVVVEKIRELFADYDAVERVTIYGSRAKGNNKGNSDIDLCVEGQTLSLSQLLQIENRLDDLLLPWKIDLSLKHKIDNLALLQHIQEVGIVFYKSRNHGVRVD